MLDLPAGLLVLALLAPQAAKPEPLAPFPWGGDVNPGAGPKLIESVTRELRSIVSAPPRERAAKAKSLAAKRAVAAIEGWKRFRDPELLELARACLEHDDWHVKHRALLWLRALRDPELLALAWPLAAHGEPRLREMAVLTCLLAWEPERPNAATAVLGAAPKEAVERRLVAEDDPHVRQSLRALLRRIEGTLVPDVVVREVVVPYEKLHWTPFVRGLRQLPEIAPGVTPPSAQHLGRESASSLRAANVWRTPLLRFGEEEVPRIQLQPFGNERKDGAIVHTGTDAGGCFDGAGVYAIADGVVRLIDAGGDAGVRLVVEHRRGEEGAAIELVNAIYMHAAGTVFVRAGESVGAGQLLGAIGLSFSIENGGQFAHLHFGLYPGAFRLDHNHGYEPADGVLDDWLDPAKCLAEWAGGR